MHHRILPIAILLAASSVGASDRNVERERLDFFESKIRPVLVKQCYECHAVDSKKLSGGLLVDSRQGLLQGGESGPAIVPNAPQESLLISALKHDDFEMPPKGKLSQQVIADFEKWIDDGATDPRDTTKQVIRPESIDIASGPGGSPADSSLARIKRSMSLAGQAASDTLGIAGVWSG